MNAGHGDATDTDVTGQVGARAFVWFAVVFTVLALLGRVTAVTDRGPALVWPAAGVTLLWLLLRRDLRWAVASLATMVAVLAVVQTVTGSPPGLTAAAVAACVVQVVTGVAVVRRWAPDLLGAGGTATLDDPRRLLRFLAAGTVATLLGALVATATLTLTGEPSGWSVLALWWGRNLAGMLTAGCAGHLLLHALLSGTGIRLPARRAPELLAVAAVVLTAFLLIDLAHGLHVVFLLITASVWCALRFSTLVVALHVTVTGAVAVVLTGTGHGPFVSTSDVSASLTTQTFVITLLLTSLAIASTRDERAALLDDLRGAQREARERAQFLETVTEAMSEGLVVMDASGTVLRMNDAARSLLGRTATGVDSGTKTKDYVVLHPDGRVLAREEHPSVRALSEGRVSPVDVVLPLRDGTLRTLNVTATAISGDPAHGAGDTPVATVSVYRDVTRERQQSDQLAEFAATAAHDLRSPLTALRGWLELASETDDPSVLAALERARGAAARMQDLITDLLDQASTEGGVLGPHELDAVPLDHVVDELVPYLAAEAVVRRDEELPVVSAHPEMLRQLLTNLLGNAVKYTEPGVRPEITLTASRQGARVVVEVRDNGIGVPEDERTRVFDRLHRAHAGDRRYDGTGLGLAICRTVVLRHGGHIECRAAPGGGTVFRFDLPAAVPEVATIAGPHPAPARATAASTAGPVGEAEPEEPAAGTVADPAP